MYCGTFYCFKYFESLIERHVAKFWAIFLCGIRLHLKIKNICGFFADFNQVLALKNVRHGSLGSVLLAADLLFFIDLLCPDLYIDFSFEWSS